MIKVLVVDDSSVVRALLEQAILEDSRFKICDFACNGKEAIEKNLVSKPDLIIMDIRMPVMDGIEASRRILKTSSPAIVAFSTAEPDEINYLCIDAGILELISKPNFIHMTKHMLSNFLDKLYLISIKHKQNIERKKQLLNGGNIKNSDILNKINFNQIDNLSSKSDLKFDLVAIGASTGGPAAILEILKSLDKNYPLPILITQHIEENFDIHLTNWLRNSTGQDINLAKDGEIIEAGKIYMAPAGHHIGIEKLSNSPNSYCIKFIENESVHFLKPSVDIMFESIADVCENRVISILLTGMGSDGADGSKAIFNKGGYTIAQSEDDCIIYGMPKSAVEKGVIKQSFTLPEIGLFLKRIKKY